MRGVLKTCFLVFVSCFVVTTVTTNDMRLKMVQIVFRHGIRTPIEFYKANPYDEEHWERYGGEGQLLPEGMNQMYDFGLYVKSLYSSFLTPHYHPNKIYVRSTNVDRAILSASTLLSALYQPNEKQKWKRDWVPVPIYTNDWRSDPIYIADMCQKYKRLRLEVYGTEIYKKLEEENLEFVLHMRNLSKIHNFELYKVWIIADNYLVANALQLHSPSWVLERIEKILELNDFMFHLNYLTHEMAKMASGPLLNEIIENLVDTVNGRKKKELYLYSCHDTYVAGLLRLFNLKRINQPNFAAALFFELYESESSGEYFIKVYYKNNPDNFINRTVFIIEGCEEWCPLEKFLELTEDKAVKNGAEICEVKEL